MILQKKKKKKEKTKEKENNTKTNDLLSNGTFKICCNQCYLFKSHAHLTWCNV